MGSEFHFEKYFDPELDFQVESFYILGVIKLKSDGPVRLGDQASVVTVDLKQDNLVYN